MTVYAEEAEARRPAGVGTKVLVLACAILAVLGSFWGIVWFIRSYVEPPRVMMPAPLVLAAPESTPVPAPAPRADAQPAETRAAPAEARAAPAAQSAPAASSPPPAFAREAADQPSASGSISDRWGPMNQAAPPPTTAAPPAAAPIELAPAALATTTPNPDEVVESAMPAIEGPPPLPRRKPVVTAARRADPPLPRPRPEAAAQPSVWTAVPTSDERFPQQ
jgi:hypothetical protein